MKVLEYINSSKLKPTGGPEGYVYNLINGKRKDTSIDYFTIDEKNGISENKKKYIPRFIRSCLRVFYEKKKIRRINKGNKKINNINNYDVIHFHSTLDLISCRESLKVFSGKVILTNHTPIPPYLELYQDYFTSLMRMIGGKKRMREYKKINEEALYMCDYIVFPCYEAEESYFLLWEGYEKIHFDNQEKIVYLPTGCIEKKPRYDSETIKNKLGLSNEFVISYVGRHNYSKGYDSLIKLSERKEIIDNNIRFLICGKEGPLFSPRNKNWIEIGWTTDADSYINSADVFVLPNKSTYFDLIMLEVLSIGKIVIASKTGGNKYFSKFESGIFLYENEDELVHLIRKISHMSKQEIKCLELKNKILFENEFSATIFSDRYEKFYNDVIKSEVKKTY